MFGILSKFAKPRTVGVHPALRRCATTAVPVQESPIVQNAVKSKSPHRIRRLVGKSLLGFTVVAGGAFAWQYNTDEGTRRSVVFWGVAFPAYVHYRWVDYWTKGKSENERDRAFNRLHDIYAPITEEIVLRLRGFYLKNAQFMSTVDFFIPPQYLEFCKRMQSEVPTEFGPGEAEEVVCRNLGLKSLDEVFSEFQPKPIGSASIGQVHLARLKKNGQVVAVKIMGRGVEARFRADIQTLIDFCNLAMPHLVAPMLEIQRQFVTEFDYRGEAQNLLDVRNNILPFFSDKVYIPAPFMDYCTKEVLVMEYVPGPTLIKGIRQSFGAYAARHGKTLEELEAEQKELMKRPDFKYRDIADEAKRMRLYNTVITAKDGLINSFKTVYNWTLVPVLRMDPVEYSKTPQLLNLGAIIHTLCEVHAWEILKDGAFSCDPHPGNILLMPDGRLGLIDLGQFKRISDGARLTLAKLAVALANDDQAEAVKTMRDYGVRSKYNKSEVCYKLAAFWYDRNTKDVTGGKNVQVRDDDEIDAFQKELQTN